MAAGGVIQEQIVAILSHKFSGPATRWPTIEQEAYAIFFGVKKLEYLLMCKTFIVETDHRNLVWMETSLVAKIIRWQIYLQAFQMIIKHINGKANGTADRLSRLYQIDYSPDSLALAELNNNLPNSDSTVSSVCTPRSSKDYRASSWW
jgi:hypothetical protein